MGKTKAQKAREDEVRGLTDFEKNQMSIVLGKKQRSIQREKCRSAGFEDINVKLERVIPIVPPVIRNDFKNEATPYACFRYIFNTKMLNEWRNTTNQYLHEKGIKQMSKGEIFVYLGMMIKMCLTPLDTMRDHWKAENKDARYLSRHRFDALNGNRVFRVTLFFSHFNEGVRRPFVSIGSYVTLDELLAGFAGKSPMTTYNPSKPNPIGHNLNMTAIKINGRPYVVGVIGRLPGFHSGNPNTHEIVEALDSLLPSDQDLHLTMDCFYNTAGVRQYLDDAGRSYTMAARADWAPHVWSTLDYQLPEGATRMFYHEDTEAIWSSHYSEKICHTVSTNVRPVFPEEEADPAEPPETFKMYRENFNWVDLFNRLFYRHSFPHRHMRWTDHLFYCLLKISLVNGWVLYRAINPESALSLRDYMDEVAEACLSPKYKV